MVDFAETERLDYAKAMEIATERNDTELIRKLEANGVPPYYGKGVTWKSAVYLNYLSAVMAGDPGIQNSGYNTLRDITSLEYGLWDQINFFRGLIRTFDHVYPQLYEFDLRKDHPKLNIPVFFFLGRHDINAPISLSLEYADLLEAPEKEVVWFEHSGHSPWINEREKFVAEVLSRFDAGKTMPAACEMSLEEWDGSRNWAYSLIEGDTLQVDVDCAGGEIDLKIYGRNGSEVYSGNDMGSWTFTVAISETDIYVVELYGRKASGRVSVKRL